MTDPSSLRAEAVRLYDDYTHGHRDRRALLRAMTLLAGSAAAADALIAGIAASPAAATIVAPDDARLATRTLNEPALGGHPASAYMALPKAGPRRPGTVVVLHENRGLTAHITDVTRRLALAGFRALAPDLLAPWGGTPADEDRAREMIAGADYDVIVAQALGWLRLARRDPATSGRAGVVGFCWGGGLANRLAVAGGPDAAVSYYGPAPAPQEAAKVAVPLMLHLAGNDARVAQTAGPWVAALRAAGRPVQAFDYPGAEHAFNNDTSAERYDKAAADLAWGRTIAFLHQRLDAR